MQLKATVTVEANAASRALQKLRGDLDGVASAAHKIPTADRLLNSYRSAANGLDRMSSSMLRYGAAAGAAGLAMRGLIDSAKEFNQSVWGANAAFLGDDKNDLGQKFKSDGERMDEARKKAEALKQEAFRLSRVLGVMPEVFSGAGEEAAKMGLNEKKSSAVMRASGAVQMSDRDAKAKDIAKAIGTYGIIYGAAEGDEAYTAQAYARASSLALAGAKTRTSASKIEEGLRNYMGIHGAFGGQFEDAVAMIAQGSQLGQMEKESGTSLKSLTGRFLNMPIGGRAAMAGAGVDYDKFMSFQAVDPLRAANQLIQLFPQQLKKGTRGDLVKMLEAERSSGTLGDPAVINRVIQRLEKQGLKFSGDADRENASNKVVSAMTGAGGKFDVLGLVLEIKRVIDAGRAGPGIWSQIGEPKRIHQYAGFMKVIEDIVKLRDELKADNGKYLGLIEQAFPQSAAGRVEGLEAAVRRLQISLQNSEAIQSFVKGLADLATAVEALDPKWANFVGTLAAGLATLAAVGAAVGLIATGMKGLGALLPKAGAAGARAPGGVGAAGNTAMLGASMFVPGAMTAMSAMQVVQASRAARAAAAAGGSAGQTFGAFMTMGNASKLGRVLGPLGVLLSLYSLIDGGMTARSSYAKNGDPTRALKAFFGMGPDADMPWFPKPDGKASSGNKPTPSEAAMAAEDLRQSLARPMGALGGNLAEDGRQLMRTAEPGIREGAEELSAAMRDAASNIRAAGASLAAGASGGGSGPLRVPLNTGPTMGGDN